VAVAFTCEGRGLQSGPRLFLLRPVPPELPSPLLAKAGASTVALAFTC